MSMTPAELEELNKKLFDGVSKGKKDLVAQALTDGADVNAKDVWGETALIYAKRKGAIQCAELLIQATPDLNAKDAGLLLIWAAQCGLLAIVKLLLLKGADVNERMRVGGMTSLDWAAYAGRSTIVKLLIKANADVNAQDEHGRAALHWAVGQDQSNIVKLLIQAKSDINAQNEWGQTALHLAAERGLLDIAKLLIKANADVNIKNADGMTPRDLAAACKAVHGREIMALFDRIELAASITPDIMPVKSKKDRIF